MEAAQVNLEISLLSTDKAAEDQEHCTAFNVRHRETLQARRSTGCWQWLTMDARMLRLPWPINMI